MYPAQARPRHLHRPVALNDLLLHQSAVGPSIAQSPLFSEKIARPASDSQVRDERPAGAAAKARWPEREGMPGGAAHAHEWEFNAGCRRLRTCRRGAAFGATASFGPRCC